MPLVNVLVNGRAYTVACDEGEEEHLRELGQYLDKRVRELSATVEILAELTQMLFLALIAGDRIGPAVHQHIHQRHRVTPVRASTLKLAINFCSALRGFPR